jgi:diguanylate cyclase (GGDEF)-like protein
VIATARRLLTRGLARRVFLLFALSALLPLAAVAVLSLTQVREILLEQGEKRLAASAKTYGMAVFERLLIAQDLALAAASRRDAALPRDAYSRRIFAAMGVFDADGRTLAAQGAPSLPDLAAEARDRLGQGKAVIVVLPGRTSPRVNLVLPAPGGEGRLLVGELAPPFLWGDADQFPASTDFCVFEEGTRTVLFCPSAAVAEAIPAIAAVDAVSTQTAIGSLRWARDGEPQRAITWGQFLRAVFGTADWVFVATQPESFQLGPVAEFRSAYVPAVALALLLAAWLAIRQSRSILEPVNRLAERSRAIARNDFDGRLDMKREDEFGELAGAFDHMSARLGRQFAAITALAEIDRLILATLDTDQVVRTVLERLRGIRPAEGFAIALFDRRDPDRALTYLAEGGGDGTSPATDAFATSQVRERLARNPGGMWLSQDEAWPPFLEGLRGMGARTVFVHPIVWRDSLCGALALGWRQAPAPGGEEEHEAREFADRIAVAVSSAWRDEQLYLQAHFDPLTGLPNRMLFRDRLEREMVRCQREGGRLALLFIDLDNFKSVNDSWGHSAGDEVLGEAARRISACVRESDTVSRLGGDEFTALLTRIQRPQQASRVAGQIADALAAEFRAAGHPAFLSASIGIVSYPGDGETAEELLRNADTAMYRAKGIGRATVVYFEDRMNAEALARHALDRDLRLALERGELQLHFQPLFDLAQGRLCSAEALLRWEHPTQGMVPPARFIPIAEESGIIEQIGQFVITEACRQLARWREDGLAIEHVAVNVSPRQFRRGDLAQFVDDCVARHGIPPSMLELEITEGLLIEQADAAREALGALSAKGVRIALDDFGTGFSSMAYLTRFPVDTIKIDRVFVDGLGGARDSEAIVSAIVAMSQALGKRVVAEGVETNEQVAILRRLRCDLVQGHILSRALPADEFSRFALACAARAPLAGRLAG